MTDAKRKTVIEALAAVMEDVQAVGKTGRNTQQNYPFRGVDAVVNAVGPALRTHGVVAMPTRSVATYRDVVYGQNKTAARECTLTVQFTFYGPAGDSVTAEVCSEALDSGDKGTAKAHSVAYRTCLLQALTIPTDEPDPDSHTYERATPAPPVVDEEADALRSQIVDAVNAGTISADMAQVAALKHGVGTAALLNAASSTLLRSLIETLGLNAKANA